jgi:Lon protease-like protein
MSRNPFAPSFDRLPRSLPIFPLAGAVVMPSTQLPLNIFEPRYLNMVTDALGEGRMIGMVQPDTGASTAEEGVHGTGTAGRITSFTETDDGRFLIVLTGVCRFDVVEEIPTTRGYRRAVTEWSRFAVDYQDDAGTDVDRGRLVELLRAYARAHEVEVAWDSLNEAESGLLVNALISNLPLDAADKQSLIETVGLDARAQLLVGLMEMAVSQSTVPTPRRH